MIWFVSTAFAGDPAAAWTGSRWSLAIEETTPSPLELSATENYSFRTRALQIEAVMSCPTAAASGKSVEVTCKFDTVAMRATPSSVDKNEALNPGNPLVLADIVDRLQKAKLELTVTADGRITTVDLPGLQASNRRESDSREVLRRLAYDLVAGIALGHPTDWQGGWVDKNSNLLRAPTQPAGSGLSKITHAVSTIDGSTVVQSQGEGTFTAPYIPWEYGYDGRMNQYGTDKGTTVNGVSGFGGAPSLNVSAANDGVMSSAGPTPTGPVPTDYTFHGTLTSVTVLNPTTGLPTQRVWAMLGRPTASSLGNMQGLSIYYSGKIKQLGKTEAVDMGMTEVVAPPGQVVEGIGTWKPLAVM